MYFIISKGHGATPAWLQQCAQAMLQSLIIFYFFHFSFCQAKRDDK